MHNKAFCCDKCPCPGLAPSASANASSQAANSPPPSAWVGDMSACVSASPGPDPAPARPSLVFTVTLGYSKTAFDTNKQAMYTAAVASAGGTSKANVKIVAITDQRRAAADSVAVETQVLAKDSAGLKKLRNTLGEGEALKAKIDSKLEENGLSPSLAVSAVELVNPAAASGAAGGAVDSSGSMNGCRHWLLLLPLLVCRLGRLISR